MEELEKKLAAELNEMGLPFVVPLSSSSKLYPSFILAQIYQGDEKNSNTDFTFTNYNGNQCLTILENIEKLCLLWPRPGKQREDLTTLWQSFRTMYFGVLSGKGMDAVSFGIIAD
jgi:hypothetical protein